MSGLSNNQGITVNVLEALVEYTLFYPVIEGTGPSTGGGDVFYRVGL